MHTVALIGGASRTPQDFAPAAGFGARLALAAALLLAAAPAQALAQAVSPDPAVQAEDPELYAPLTPLDEFQVQATAPTEAAPPETPSIRYTVSVTGLEAVGLHKRFRSLSALMDSRTAQTLGQLRARAAGDRDTILKLLRSEGYYDGEVVLTVTPQEGGGAAVTLAATPGGRYHLGEVIVTGPPTEPTVLARQALPLMPGDPLIAAEVVSAEAQVTLKLPEEGYPFVKLGQRDVALHGDTLAADYTLPLDPGPRSGFGKIQVAGDPVLPAGHLHVISRFRPGQLYDSRLVDDLRRALVATSLYASVSVEPKDTGQAAPGGLEQVDIVVRGQRGPSHSLSASIGYETGLGATVQGSWTSRNLFPPEGGLTINGVVGTQQQLLGVRFRRANAGQRDRTIEARAQVSRQTVKAYDANTVLIGGQVSRQSTPIWQKRWTYSAGAEASVSDESGYDLSVRRNVRRTYEVLSLPLQVQYDRSNSLLDPTRGFRLTARPTPEVSFGDGTRPYFKPLVEGTGYLPVGQSVVLAGRLRFGALFGARAEDIAPSRRFYAGGGGSVRGFGYQELGPKDPAHNPIGGASLSEFSVETRYRFGDFGVVGFIDGGQVSRASTPGFDDLRLGAGIGARYYTNFGPMRLDVATPLSRRAGESSIAVYVSIGQAF